MPLPLLAIPYAAEIAAVGVAAIVAKLSLATVGNEIEEQAKKPAVVITAALVAGGLTYWLVKKRAG